MGFFYHSAKTKKAKAVRVQRPASNNKQNAEILNRLGCKGCPLDKADVCTPKMKPTLPDECLLYFLDANPSAYDDEETGKPQTGKAGKLLRSVIPDDSVCAFDNCVRTRTPKGRAPTWHEIESCRQYVTASIEQAKPRLIVGLGPIALQWALNSTDMAGMRGRLFAIKVGNHSCWFMPTNDPQHAIDIAEQRTKKSGRKFEPIRTSVGNCLKFDVKRAFKLANKLPPAKVDTPDEAKAGVQCLRPRNGLEQLMALLAKAKKAPLKDIDIETSTLRPYSTGARILSVAIAFGDTVFSFLYDHPRDPWKPDEREAIGDALFSILKDETIVVAHNAPFECEWFIKDQGVSVINHLAWECTMMQAHHLDERRGNQGKGDDSRRATYQSLDFLCRQHFGIPIKKLFDLKMDDLINADIDTLLLYGGIDAKYGLKLFKHQHKLLKNEGLVEAYRESLPRQPTVAIMQSIGINISHEAITEAQGVLNEELAGIEDEINSLKVVQAFKKDRGSFNPQSGPDTLALFRDYLKREEVYVTDKLGNEKESTDKNVLDKIDHPLAELIVRLRNRAKMKSTYVDCFEQGKGALIYPSGKIHTTFNTTFTETGRTSSDEPNQQNWPKRNDAWVRKAVVPPDGYVLLAFDYGQLEACTSAMCSKDKVLVKALWEEYDIHMEWTEKWHKVYPLGLAGGETLKDKKTAKHYRSIVKNKLVFPAIFGASNNSIAGYLKTPEDKIAILMDEFWDTFSDLKRWQDNLMRSYYDNGWVESPTGRRHRYPLTRNQAINFPIQSVAADIVCDAMNALSFEALETGDMWMHPVLNIHDDLTFVVPDDDAILEKAIRRISKVMLTPPYDFINVPMSVECSIGTNWYEMSDVTKLWSNKKYD